MDLHLRSREPPVLVEVPWTSAFGQPVTGWGGEGGERTSIGGPTRGTTTDGWAGCEQWARDWGEPGDGRGMGHGANCDERGRAGGSRLGTPRLGTHVRDLGLVHGTGEPT